jgi:hypothetical protein
MGQNGQAQSPQAPPPVPPPVPTISWYVAVNGQQNGPFTNDQLSQMVTQGALKRDTLVWKQGMASWVQAGNITELSVIFANLPPPLPM